VTNREYAETIIDGDYTHRDAVGKVYCKAFVDLFLDLNFRDEIEKVIPLIDASLTKREDKLIEKTISDIESKLPTKRGKKETLDEKFINEINFDFRRDHESKKMEYLFKIIEVELEKRSEEMMKVINDDRYKKEMERYETLKNSPTILAANIFQDMLGLD